MPLSSSSYHLLLFVFSSQVMLYWMKTKKSIWSYLLEVYYSELVFGLELEVVKQIEDRLIKDFLDVLILVELAKGRPLGGRDIITLVSNKFGSLLSSGTVYSVLYSMEREGMIASGSEEEKRRVYLLTDKGKESIKTISSARQKIMSLIAKIFGTHT